MYSRDIVGKKREKLSFFSVVTEISTHGDTLKLRRSTFWKQFLDAKDHEDNESSTQIAIGDDNKGHIVNFPKFSTEKNDIFSTKKFIKKLSIFFRSSFRWRIVADDPLHLIKLFDVGYLDP